VVVAGLEIEEAVAVLVVIAQTLLLALLPAAHQMPLAVAVL
jgi:hypothetical protein